MCRLLYQAMAEGTLILRQCATNGCLVWVLKFSPRESSSEMTST